jgi:multiple antibiotic resistance protein
MPAILPEVRLVGRLRTWHPGPPVPVLEQLVRALLVVPLTLLPIINPLSSAPVFMMTAGDDPANARRLARQVALNCWYILLGALFVGSYVLEFFGISLPIVRVGGGLLVAASGWRMLNHSEDDEVRAAVARGQAAALSPRQVAQRSFFPLTFPLTTGPGTIAAAIAIGANLPRGPARYAVAAIVAAAGATFTVIVIYLVYRNAPRLLARLGDVGTLVMARLMAFILLCIGIQILWNGWSELNRLGRG